MLEIHFSFEFTAKIFLFFIKSTKRIGCINESLPNELYSLARQAITKSRIVLYCQELVLASLFTSDSSGIPGPWTRVTLDVARGGNWPPEGNRAYSSVSRTRGAKTFLRRVILLQEERRIRGRARIRACTRGGGSDGLEEIEGRISSKAAANTEILPSLLRPWVIPVCTLLQAEACQNFSRNTLYISR